MHLDFIFPLLEALNINLERVIFENQSRNTIENATFTKKLVIPSLNQHWIIITSAFHMPRAKTIFENEGLVVVPFPVNFRKREGRLTPMSFIPSSSSLGETTMFVK